MKTYVMGIDTSSYTTSVAVVDSITDEIICNYRKILAVPVGQHGLRQQDAVFFHLKNFEELISRCDFDFNLIETVSVSNRPRNVEGSYMPVFTVGQNYGKVIAKSINANYIEYSHQENHIAAAMIDHYKNINDNILTIHISGGTTEYLSVKKLPKGYDAKIIGGSNDITFGQLIDRIGVYMGFQFPCGFHMERYINENDNIEQIKIPKISGDRYINLSGMENYYKKIYDNNNKQKSAIIKSLFEYTSKCLTHIIENIKNSDEFNTIIITGGVAANMTIRNALYDSLKDRYKIIFPTTEQSSDNAVGNAYLPIIDRWSNENKTN